MALGKKLRSAWPLALGILVAMGIRAMERPARASSVECHYEGIDYQLEEFVRIDGTAPVESQARWWRPRATLYTHDPALVLDHQNPDLADYLDLGEAP